MQKSQLAKNLGYHVRLRPIACRLDPLGLELPFVDDHWVIRSALDDGIKISNIRTQHFFKLGYDHVHHFTSDTTQASTGTKYGFLTLLVQIYLQGENLTIEPTLRPGERVPPSKVKIVEREVDIRYPSDSGIQAALIARECQVAWVRVSRLARLIDIEGWQRVIVRDSGGLLVQFRIKDYPEDQVLIWRPAR